MLFSNKNMTPNVTYTQQKKSLTLKIEFMAKQSGSFFPCEKTDRKDS